MCGAKRLCMPKNPAKSPIEERGGEVLIRLRVQPRASRNSIHFNAEGQIRVLLTAPPVEGAANKALCGFIAGRLGLPKRAVRIESGAKSRSKTVAVLGLSLQRVEELFFADRT